MRALKALNSLETWCQEISGNWQRIQEKCYKLYTCGIKERSVLWTRWKSDPQL